MKGNLGNFVKADPDDQDHSQDLHTSETDHPGRGLRIFLYRLCVGATLKKNYLDSFWIELIMRLFSFVITRLKYSIYTICSANPGSVEGHPGEKLL